VIEKSLGRDERVNLLLVSLSMEEDHFY